MTVCLVSPAMVESTAGVAAVRLLSCSSVSGYAPAVSVLATVSPIVDPASDPATYTNYPCRLSSQLSLRLFFRLFSTVTFPTTCSSVQFNIHLYSASTNVSNALLPTGTVVLSVRVQSRFAETLTLSLTLISANRVSANREDTKCQYLQNKNVLSWCL